MPLWRKLLKPPAIKNTFWQGASFGLFLFIVLLAFLAGYLYNTGIPRVLLGLAFLLASVVILLLIRVVITLLAHLISKIATSILITIVTTVAMVFVIRYGGFSWPQAIFYPSLLIAFVGQILIFGSAYTLVKKQGHSVLMIVLLLIGIGIEGVSLYWVFSKGDNSISPEFTPKVVEQLQAPNPSESGEYRLEYFTYGSGTDKQRPEFGDEVTYHTAPVDASLILSEWKGTKANRREWFWGFGVKEFPLNGRVWMPDGEGAFPLVVIVHGNHGMEDFSDAGYGYIGELLSSRGFIVVSVDENFINGTWSGDFRGREMPARGWLLLKHLEVWKQWNDDGDHPLSGKVDMENIILAGHSRGGEAVAIAAAFNKLNYFPDNALLKFDFNFKIKGLISIAPTDKRYARRLELQNVNYLSIQGSYDSDEASFFGWRQARRIHFSDSNFWFKSGIYVHRANHGQFNTTWGSRDFGLPGGFMLDINSLLGPKEQQQIAMVYIAAFVETVCRQNSEYLPMFRNSQIIADWLPATVFLNTYVDSKFISLENFEYDIDIATSESGKIQSENLAVWREDILLFRDDDRQGSNVLVLGWKQDSLERDMYYQFELTHTLAIDSLSKFAFNASHGDPKELDIKENGDKKDSLLAVNFTIQLIDSLGNTLNIPFNHKKYLAPRLEIEYMKLKSLSGNLGKSWESTFEFFDFDLNDFEGEKDLFQGIKFIRFLFDQTSNGMVIIDDIGFYPSQGHEF